MRLCDADTQPAETIGLERVELPGGGWVVLDAARAIDAQCDGFDLFAQGGRVWIEQLEVARLVGGFSHHLGEIGGALSTVDEVVADGRAHAEMLRKLLN